MQKMIIIRIKKIRKSLKEINFMNNHKVVNQIKHMFKKKLFLKINQYFRNQFIKN